MDITGSLINPDDKDRLDKWRWEHERTMEGFREDPALPPMSFRTEGEIVYASSDFYRKLPKNFPGRARNT